VSETGEGAQAKKAAPWIVVAVLLVGTLAFAVLGGGGDKPSEGEKKSDVERVCKDQFIADRLKAPSTAEYDLTVTGGPITYTANGTVDSENGFGAMLRSDVTCVVRDDGDKWVLESVTLR
jgi:hypothetical protein